MDGSIALLFFVCERSRHTKNLNKVFDHKIPSESSPWRKFRNLYNYFYRVWFHVIDILIPRWMKFL